MKSRRKHILDDATNPDSTSSIETQVSVVPASSRYYAMKDCQHQPTCSLQQEDILVAVGQPMRVPLGQLGWC